MQWKLFADLAEAAGEREVEIEVGSNATVADALDSLLDAHPPLGERVLDENGDLHTHVNVLLNGTRLAADELDTPVETDDELALFPPVSGG